MVLFFVPYLRVLYICTKVHENTFKHFRVIKHTGFVMDELADRQEDNCGKNSMSAISEVA